MLRKNQENIVWGSGEKGDRRSSELLKCVKNQLTTDRKYATLKHSI